jgi:hypothetical protein
MQSFFSKITIILIAAVLMLSCSNKKAEQKRRQELEDSLNKVFTTSLENQIQKCNCLDTFIVKDTDKHPLFEGKKIISYTYKENIFKDSPEYENIIEGGKLNRKILKEQVLNNEQVLTLAKILYNRKKLCDNGQLIRIADCGYNPHHCLVFYDKKNKAVDFIEICFICDAKMGSKNYFGDFCGQTYCDLRKLFKELGHANLSEEQCD